MPLLASYSFKNIFARKLTSVLTILGIALVVFVFCATLMLSHGLKETLVATGSDDNAIVIRKASQTEVQSIISRDMAQVISTDAAIALDENSAPLVCREILVLINKSKRITLEQGNVPVRGVDKNSVIMRPQIKLLEGRMWNEGTSEVIAGAKAAESFTGCGLGEQVRFGMRDWTVVGIFEADGAGFESELWGDVDQMMDAFERPVYSSLTMRLKAPDQFSGMKERLDNDPRLEIESFREKEYYLKQSSFLSGFITILGNVISIIFSLGAIVGAMITMYASVANRTIEIGTLRALGFSRASVLMSFLIESILISMIGGIIGIGCAYFLRLVEVSTTNWDTFAELAFSFEISASIAIEALIFALVMGFVGGFLPAVRASRMRIINALKGH